MELVNWTCWLAIFGASVTLAYFVGRLHERSRRLSVYFSDAIGAVLLEADRCKQTNSTESKARSIGSTDSLQAGTLPTQESSSASIG